MVKAERLLGELWERAVDGRAGAGTRRRLWRGDEDQGDGGQAERRQSARPTPRAQPLAGPMSADSYSREAACSWGSSSHMSLFGST